MYELLGICLALAALLTLNALASLAAAVLWRGIERRAEQWPAARRARWLLALRILPPAGALFCVVALLIPAYLTYEPRHTAEVVSGKLAALALVSIMGLALAAWRGLAAWLATRRLLADWLHHAEPIRLENVSIPAYHLPHPFPVIAIVGAIRPRLFVADHLFSSLSREEMAAVVAHENGHLAARDNLKRGLLRACRDALAIVPCGRALDRAWAASSESAADEHAARAGAAVALDLAAALIKIARLAPPGARPAMPAGTLLTGDDMSSLGRRVSRLTHLAARPPHPKREARGPDSLMWVCLCGFLTTVALTATDPQILSTVHALMERIVSALQ